MDYHEAFAYARILADENRAESVICSCLGVPNVYCVFLGQESRPRGVRLVCVVPPLPSRGG